MANWLHLLIDMVDDQMPGTGGGGSSGGNGGGGGSDSDGDKK